MIKTNTLSILQTAEIAPVNVLGGEGKIIRNRKLLEQRLRRHKRVVGACTLVLYAVVVLIAIAGVVLATSNKDLLSKGLLPYLGGATFIALLEMARRLLKDYSLAALPLTVAQHVSDDELARFIETLLVVEKATKRARKPQWAAGKSSAPTR